MVKYGKKELDILVKQIAFEAGRSFGIGHYSGRYCLFYFSKDKINSDKIIPIELTNELYDHKITEYLKPYVLYHVLKAILRFIKITGVVNLNENT